MPIGTADKTSGREAAKRKSKLQKVHPTFNGVPVVSLLVGQNEAPFNIHREILCRSSRFFTLAFMGAGAETGTGAGEFKEKSTQCMYLPDDDPETIDRLTQWLYFKQIQFDHLAIGKSKTYGSVPLMQLATLYVAADKFGILALKNTVIDQLWKLLARDKNEVRVGDKMIEYVYENTLPGSKVRRILIHWQAHSASLRHKNMPKLVREYPQFAASLLARMSRRCPNPWEWEESSEAKTAYHEGDGEKNDGKDDSGGEGDAELDACELHEYEITGEKE